VRYENNISDLPNIPALKISQVFGPAEMPYIVKIVPGKREVLICQSCEILAIIIREDFAVFVKLRDWRKETAAGKRCRFTRFS
jgi:hypothetical protein